MREAEIGTSELLPPFFMSVEHLGRETVISVRGEVDLSNCGRLREAIEPCIDAGAALVIDLSGVTFMDSSCLKALVWATTAIAPEGGSVRVRNPSRPARRILELSGLDFLVG